MEWFFVNCLIIPAGGDIGDRCTNEACDGNDNCTDDAANSHTVAQITATGHAQMLEQSRIASRLGSHLAAWVQFKHTAYYAMFDSSRTWLMQRNRTALAQAAKTRSWDMGSRHRAVKEARITTLLRRASTHSGAEFQIERQMINSAKNISIKTSRFFLSNLAMENQGCSQKKFAPFWWWFIFSGNKVSILVIIYLILMKHVSFLMEKVSFSMARNSVSGEFGEIKYGEWTIIRK